MTSKNFLFTSESVTEGHPDKVCDQISDAILDEFLTKDRGSRVAAETTVTTGMALVCGEITADCYVDIPQVVRNTIKNIGYVGSNAGGFDANTCAVLTSIDEQSTDIGNGVNKAFESREANADTSTVETEEIGAGDQGIMFGYACNETPELMPLPISLAHKLSYRLAQVRKEGLVNYLRPDGKSQVTVEYVDGKPSRIHTILLSTQHNPEINGISDNQKVQDIIREDLKNLVINFVFENESIKPDENTIILINPSGRFVIGGPQGDSGLTGRKIIVDTYGGYSRHGGGAFSGKDPTKVDRSAAYASRYVAKNIVAAGLADKCEIELAYAIGVAEPLSIFVDTFGTGRISDDEISKLVPEARVEFAHGKMTGAEIESIMQDFIEHKTDVLVCTTILESGIDIPNANTIIVENADRLGLAQLYQIRGRVGRSDRQGYAYVTYRRDKLLSEVADKRLKAIKEFTEFGSGFKIAMRDLEIRGAGSMLGEIQSGHMEQVGYDTYCKLLDEVVREMQGTPVKEEKDVQIDIDLSSYIPETYIEDSAQKIEIYQDIALCRNNKDIEDVIDEIIDRYGTMPTEVENLIEIARIKILARNANVLKLSQKGKNVVFYLDKDNIQINGDIINKLVTTLL